MPVLVSQAGYRSWRIHMTPANLSARSRGYGYPSGLSRIARKVLPQVINTHYTGKTKRTTCYMPTSHKAVMYIRNYDEAQYELAGSKLAADTMVYRITSLGLSVLGILWTLGKTRKTEVYSLIHRDYTTVSHNMTALIKDGYIYEQVISHKEKYISLTGEGKEIYAEFISKSAALTQKLRAIKKGNSN